MADTATLSDLTARRAPRRRAKPLLAWFIWSHDLNLRSAAEGIGGVSHEQVRLLCLPFGDPKRVEPTPDLAHKIAHWSGGVVAPWTFEDTPGARAIGLSGVTTGATEQ